MNKALLILNAGSSSLKFAVYTAAAGETAALQAGASQPLFRGGIEGIGTDARLQVVQAPSTGALGTFDIAAHTHGRALHVLLDWLEAEQPGLDFHAAGHRVVHGGSEFSQPVRIDDAILSRLELLIPLSPLHQPHSLGAIRALAQLRPELLQVACFDTAFHHTLPTVARNFALPRSLTERGIRRYGFHGLSYAYIASVLPEYLGDGAEGRVIVAHLGNGASLCALQRRQSMETSMSFTPLDGIPMGSRCGALDPGVLLYLMRELGMQPEQLDDMLHHQSGLLGVSGMASDVRTLLASGAPHATEALDLFTYRVSQAVASHAVATGGIDALVFTAGIGEHAAPVRAAICQRLAWLGLHLDNAANERQQTRISQPDSPVSVWIIPTNEESIIARDTWRLTSPEQAL